jgi:hypothetical protein
MADDELYHYLTERNPETGDFLFPVGSFSDADYDALKAEVDKRFGNPGTGNGSGDGIGNGTGNGTGQTNEPSITTLVGAAKTNEDLKKFFAEKGGDLTWLGNQISGTGTRPTEDSFAWSKNVQAVAADGKDEYNLTDSTGKVFSLFVNVLPPVQSESQDDYFVDENGIRHYYVKLEISSPDDPNKKIQVQIYLQQQDKCQDYLV